MWKLHLKKRRKEVNISKLHFKKMELTFQNYIIKKKKEKRKKKKKS